MYPNSSRISLLIHKLIIICIIIPRDGASSLHPEVAQPSPKLTPHIAETAMFAGKQIKKTCIG